MIGLVTLDLQPGLATWMSARITGRLDPRPGERVADIGCGTGLYARGLAERAGRVVCVDPAAAMLDQLPPESVGSGALVPVRASVEDLAAGRVWMPCERFDVVLTKEALHHTADKVAALWLARRTTNSPSPAGGC